MASRTARCRFLPTSPSRSPSRSATRPSTRATRARRPRRRPASTSRPSSCRSSTSSGSRFMSGSTRSARVTEDDLSRHALHGERYEVRPEAWERIEAAERVLAVGTTTVRVLESLARGAPLAGRTELFVLPGFEFRRVDALLTNFHLPRSTLLALVMAFAGVEETRAPLPARGRGALPVLLLRRCHADPVSFTRHRHRRSGARRRPPHRARRRSDPGLHAGRDEGDGQDARPRRGAGDRRAHRPRQHLPPVLPARSRADRRARRAPPLHGLGRPDPDRLGRLPGLLAARHDRRGRRRRRHLPLGLRRGGGALHARARRGDPGRPRLRHRHVLRPGAAARPPAPRARGGGATHDALGGAGRSGPRARPASCSSESRRVASTRSCDGDRSRRSPRSTSTGTRSAASRSARAASRCSS